jgi:pectate lyase
MSLDFMQDNEKADNTVILAAVDKSGEIASVVTREGGIACKIGTNSYKTLLADYLPNKWYSVRLEINLSAGTFNACLDGAVLARDFAILRDVDAVSSMTSYTCYSPGYFIDNVSVATSQTPADVGVNGPAEVSIPQSGAAAYSYSFYALDAVGVPVINPQITVALAPESIPGVTLTPGDGPLKYTLTVDSSASVGEAAIAAAYEGWDVSRVFHVNLARAAASALVIKGPAKVAFQPGDEPSAYAYAAKLTDQLGNEIKDQTFTWALEGTIPEGVSVDAATGVVDVARETPKDTYIKITAASPQNPGIKGEKTLTLLDLATYISDANRLAALKENIDNIIEKGGDNKHGTPLIADGLDQSTELPAEWIYPEYAGLAPAAMSNLAEQGKLMRTLDALTTLTGDERYHDRLYDIYQYYLDHYIAPNGLIYWGGHCLVDMNTLKVVESPHEKDIHELKGAFPYTDPLFALDPAAAERMIKAIWVAHMQDWKTLIFNRHGHYSAALDVAGTYDNPAVYDDVSTGLIATNAGIPFKGSGDDFIDFSTELYNRTGDDNALLWAYRMWKKYYDCQLDDTHIPPFQFTTSHGAPGVMDPLKTLEPIGAWWLADPMPRHYTYGEYGDRFENQFADDLIDQGFLTENERWKAREAYYMPDYANMSNQVYIDSKLAKALGLDTEKGRQVMENCVKGMSFFAKNVYIPETNQYRTCLIDGTDLTGFIFKRTGYYGKAGTIWKWKDLSPHLLLPAVRAYIEAEPLDSLAQDRADIWEMIRNLCKGFDLGDVGENGPGDGMKLDMGTSNNNAMTVMALSYLYDYTGITAYLDLARRVADNMIASNFYHGMFIEGGSFQYFHFGGLGDVYEYALVLLEAATQNNLHGVPEYIRYTGYYDADSVDERGRIYEQTNSGDFFWNRTLASVYVTDIVPAAYEFVVPPGGEVSAGIVIEPDDASSKGVSWSSDDYRVARMDDDTGTIIAASEGETWLRGISADQRASVSIKVTVSKDAADSGGGER